MIKFLFQPIKPFYINQHFGENKSCVDLATGVSVITCDGLNPPPGYRSLYGPKGHLGLDLAAYHGQPVYCACDGTVSSIDTNPKSGLDVRVVSDANNETYRHIYEHLLGYQSKIGDKVEAGDLIGWADNTGYSSGDHLHFELQQWKAQQWVPVDPMPFMEDIYALEFAGLWKQVKELTARLADYLADKLR